LIQFKVRNIYIRERLKRRKREKNNRIRLTKSIHLYTCTPSAHGRMGLGRPSQAAAAEASSHFPFRYFFSLFLSTLPVGTHVSYRLQPPGEFHTNTQLPNRLQSPEIRYKSVRIRAPYSTKSPLFNPPHQLLSVFPKIANRRPPEGSFRSRRSSAVANLKTRFQDLPASTFLSKLPKSSTALSSPLFPARRTPETSRLRRRSCAGVRRF
jgi:hypothetical protein